MKAAGQDFAHDVHLRGFSWLVTALGTGIGVLWLILSGCSGGGNGAEAGSETQPSSFSANGTFSGNLTVTQSGQNIRLGVAAILIGGTTVSGTLDTTDGRHVTLSGQATATNAATVSGTISGVCQGSLSATVTLSADNTLSVNGNGSDCNGTLSIQGSVNPVTCTTVTEQEPNNSRSQFQDLGDIAPGGCFTITGTLATAEQFDTFGFITQTPQTILATLTHEATVNFDLAFFSEELNNFILTCSSPTSPELCSVTRTISARDRFYIIATNIRPGSGNYTLQVSSTPRITASSSSSLVAAPREQSDETIELPGYLTLSESSHSPRDDEEQILFDMLLGEFLIP